MTRFYLSLGANLGEREKTLHQAIQLLQEQPQVKLLAVSPFYETAPWGKTDQPAFINAAIAVETPLSGAELLAICQQIEKALGRVRHEKWGARTIDIDLVYSPTETSQSNFLTLPHPYLTQRAFVLVPLRDIAPRLLIEGRQIDYWLEKLKQRPADTENK